MMNTTNTIKQLRFDLCLSREELANQIGVTYVTLANYENEKHLPRVSVLRKLKKIADEKGVEFSIEGLIK